MSIHQDGSTLEQPRGRYLEHPRAQANAGQCLAAHVDPGCEGEPADISSIRYA